jgi:hypothetical protein
MVPPIKGYFHQSTASLDSGLVLFKPEKTVQIIQMKISYKSKCLGNNRVSANKKIKLPVLLRRYVLNFKNA